MAFRASTAVAVDRELQERCGLSTAASPLVRAFGNAKGNAAMPLLGDPGPRARWGHEWWRQFKSN